MRGEVVPDKDHLTRYCGGSRVKENGSISGEAFKLRMLSGQPEAYLSVNWLEFLEKENRNEEIGEIQKILAAKFPRGIGARARIAVLNVEEMCKHVHLNSEDRRVLRILHEPEDNDPSHSGIYNLNLEDDLVADLIAQTVIEIHPAKEN